LKMLAEIITEKVVVPEGVQVSVDNNVVSVKAKGELSRDFASKQIIITLDNDAVVLTSKKASQREKRMIKTFAAHIRNMMKGASEGHVYRLKICSGHFPMNVSISNDELVVKNFLGEKNPRILKFQKNQVSLKIEGDKIIAEGSSIELVGQTAANVEQLTRISNKDKRIFQDGIYLIEKDGKEI